MPYISDIPVSKRAFNRLMREHAGLQSDSVRLGKWPFRHYEYKVSCSCGWVYPRNIPDVPLEVSYSTRFLIRLAMDNHLLAEFDKLSWIQKI